MKPLFRLRGSRGTAEPPGIPGRFSGYYYDEPDYFPRPAGDGPCGGEWRGINDETPVLVHSHLARLKPTPSDVDLGTAAKRGKLGAVVHATEGIRAYVPTPGRPEGWSWRVGRIAVAAAITRYFGFVVFALAMLLPTSSELQAVDVDQVSMVSLLADPRRFDGVRVLTFGYAVVEFENSAVYLSASDADHVITANAVWLDLESMPDPSVSGGYVLVEGAFDATSRGHGGMFAGTIRAISRLERWR